jgi:hypothetical protein
MYIIFKTLSVYANNKFIVTQRTLTTIAVSAYYVIIYKKLEVNA